MIIRPAELADAASVAHIIAQTWSEDLVPSAFTRQAAGNDSSLLVAVEDGLVVGFVSSFLTRPPEVMPRWEVDLLAVLPPYQGRGIGRRLIGETWPDVERFGAVFARALIATSNISSQRAFEWAWYHTSGLDHLLYIWQPKLLSGGLPQSAAPATFLPVSTLTYCGIWIEDFLPSACSFSEQSGVIAAARHQAAVLDGTRVGIVLPVGEAQSLDPALIAAAQLVDRYQWWVRLASL